MRGRSNTSNCCAHCRSNRELGRAENRARIDHDGPGALIAPPPRDKAGEISGLGDANSGFSSLDEFDRHDAVRAGWQRRRS